MRECAFECAHTVNNKATGCSLSPAFRLFGRGQKAYGALYHLGEPVGAHPDVADPSTEVARRLNLRRVARELAEQNEAVELEARSVSARSRTLKLYSPGDRIFFYRSHPIIT
jgi:hypothetical protein